jgi:hypothetical protein
MNKAVEPIGEMTQVRGRLALAGYRSLSEWAEAHDIKPVTARRVIYDWGMRTDREPHGGIAREVMRKLRATLAELEGAA